MRHHLAAAAFVLASISRPAAAQDVPAQARELATALAAIATSGDGIDYEDFVRGRFGPGFAGADPRFDELATLRHHPASSVLALLQHRDSGVRTLALLLLYDREEPRWLPQLAAFAGDDGPAIPDRTPGNVAWDGQRMLGQPWITTPRTIGEVVQRMLAFYYRASGFAVAGDATQQFDAYWQPRRQRAHCAGWLRMRLWRAYGGSTPVRADVAERLRRVRSAVDALPSPDRELLLIGLPEARYEDLVAFASDAERVAAARALGDDALLRALVGQFASDDPDLPRVLGTPTPGNGVGSLPGFVLSPGRAIFAPATAERLLALAATQHEVPPTSRYTGAGWVTTAASLQPARATAWLTAALERFSQPHEAPERTAVLQAWVRFGDASSARTVAQAFWSGELIAIFGAQLRGWVLDTIAAVGGDKAQSLFVALVDAAEFAAADPNTTIAFARALAQAKGATVIEEEELQELWHPLGLHQLVRADAIAAAKVSHPAETERVLATTARWREAIRRVVHGR